MPARVAERVDAWRARIAARRLRADGQPSLTAWDRRVVAMLEECEAA